MPKMRIFKRHTGYKKFSYLKAANKMCKNFGTAFEKQNDLIMSLGNMATGGIIDKSKTCILNNSSDRIPQSLIIST